MALRVVVAGLGSRGREWARFARSSGVASLVGAVEPHASVREQAVSDPSLNGVPVVEDLDAVEASTTDAVIVATAAQQHVAVAERAINRGLAVMVEKPFALALDEAVRVVRLAESRGVPLQVVQNYRYMRAHRTVRRIVQEGTLGRLSEVSCRYWRATHVVNAGLAALELSALWETGVHHLDALRYCLGRQVIGVAADGFSAPWTTELRGTSFRALLEFEGGVRGDYGVSWDAPGHERFEAGQQFYERLTGERGTLHVLQRWLVICLKAQWPRFVPRGRRTEAEEITLLKQLANACGGTGGLECSGRDNLQTLAILSACERASRTRRWVDPQELLREAGA